MAPLGGVQLYGHAGLEGAAVDQVLDRYFLHPVLAALAVGLLRGQGDLGMGAGLKPLQRGLQRRNDVIGAVQIGGGFSVPGRFKLFSAGVAERVVEAGDGLMAYFHVHGSLGWKREFYHANRDGAPG